MKAIRMANEVKPGFMVYHDKFAQINKLPDDQFHWLMNAVFEYSSKGELAQTDNPALAVLFDIWRELMDADTAKYKGISEARRQAANARYQKSDANADFADDFDAKVANAGFADKNDANDANYQLSTINNHQSSIIDHRSPVNEQPTPVKDVGAERCASHRSTPPPQPTPSEFNLILNDGTEYNVPMENVEKYKTLYPAVDVEQELRKMVGWCFNNEKYRKTRGGIKRFIGGWLAKEQDGARAKAQPKPSRQEQQIDGWLELARKLGDEDDEN